LTVGSAVELIICRVIIQFLTCSTNGPRKY